MTANLAVDQKLRQLRRRANRLALALAYRFHWPLSPGLPQIMMIEPTNLCNLRCPLCPTGNRGLQRRKGFMEMGLYRRILAETDGALERLRLYNFGEPFLHPHIFEMISLAQGAEVKTLVSTNGLVFADARQVDALIDSRLDRLRVSIDGASQQTHQQYRVGSQLETILQGVELLLQRQRLREKKRPRVELQFIVMRHNEHELPEMRSLAKSLGVPLRIKSVGLGSLVQPRAEQPGAPVAQPAPPEQDPARWLPVGSAAPRRYDQHGGVLTLAGGGMPAMCDHPWHRLVVNWDGSATACCYDHEGLFAFGSATHGIRRLWNGAGIQNLRRAMRRGDLPEVCLSCSVRLWNSQRMAIVENDI